jgi:hypothetical protein
MRLVQKKQGDRRLAGSNELKIRLGTTYMRIVLCQVHIAQFSKKQQMALRLVHQAPEHLGAFFR